MHPNGGECVNLMKDISVKKSSPAFQRILGTRSHSRKALCENPVSVEVVISFLTPSNISKSTQDTNLRHIGTSCMNTEISEQL